MELNTQKVDSANAVISATITKESINKGLDIAAQNAAKNMNIAGFRKGKVPTKVIKDRYGAKLEEDATNDALKTLFQDGIKKLDIKNEDLIGEPSITKFEKKDDGSIEVEMKLACKPKIELGDYKSLIPEIKLETIEAKDIDERLEAISSSSAPIEKLKRKRVAKSGDYALIDFEGFVDDVAFEGGKAEKYLLQLGSNSFIPGFEDQVIGMKYEEQKDINVKFPDEYQSKDLAGKDAVFKVTLHELRERTKAEIDDELAKKMLPNEKDATVEILRQKIEEQLINEKKSVLYREELKPLYIDKVIEAINFDLPQIVIDQEINMAINNKVRTMNQDEIKALQEDSSKIEALKDEFKDDATKSVKATFIIDALAKAEDVTVSDQEVSQILYFEAMQMGQNPQEVIKKYQEAGYLPAVKMSLIEDKVITKLFDEKLGK